jgi:hypothetical protein
MKKTTVRCVVRSRDCRFIYFVPEQTVMTNLVQGEVALPK